MIYIIMFLLVVLCMIMDRYRGDKEHIFHSRAVEKIIYGLAIGTLLGIQNLYLIGAFSLLWLVGSSPGWGTCIGAHLRNIEMEEDNEWWQFGIFNTNVRLACALRGFIWGACALPLAYFDTLFYFVPVVTTIGFLVALELVRKNLQIVSNKNNDVWAQQEYFRGFLFAIGAIIINLLT
jgi:hypothetical protein